MVSESSKYPSMQLPMMHLPCTHPTLSAPLMVVQSWPWLKLIQPPHDSLGFEERGVSISAVLSKYNAQAAGGVDAVVAAAVLHGASGQLGSLHLRFNPANSGGGPSVEGIAALVLVESCACGARGPVLGLVAGGGGRCRHVGVAAPFTGAGVVRFIAGGVSPPFRRWRGAV